MQAERLETILDPLADNQFFIDDFEEQYEQELQQRFPNEKNTAPIDHKDTQSEIKQYINKVDNLEQDTTTDEEYMSRVNKIKNTLLKLDLNDTEPISFKCLPKQQKNQSSSSSVTKRPTLIKANCKQDKPSQQNTQIQPLYSSDEEQQKIDFPPKPPFKKSSLSNELTLKGAKIQQNSLCQIEFLKQKNSLKISNLRQFFYTQLAEDYEILAVIKRYHTGFLNLGIQYHVHVQDNDHFLFAVDKSGLTTYIFSTNKHKISQKSNSYLAKMECNLKGSEFVLTDDGFDCTETKKMQTYKRELAYIQYNEENGPLEFTTYISTNSNQNTAFTVLDKDNKILYNKWKRKQRKQISMLFSKKPVYDTQKNIYKLDFQGVAKIPSIKNFILTSQQYPNSLIFGRQDKDTFVFKIKAPFSLLQATAICLSSIHSKFY